MMLRWKSHFSSQHQYSTAARNHTQWLKKAKVAWLIFNYYYLWSYATCPATWPNPNMNKNSMALNWSNNLVALTLSTIFSFEADQTNRRPKIGLNGGRLISPEAEGLLVLVSITFGLLTAKTRVIEGLSKLNGKLQNWEDNDDYKDLQQTNYITEPSWSKFS